MTDAVFDVGGFEPAIAVMALFPVMAAGAVAIARPPTDAVREPANTREEPRHA